MSYRRPAPQIVLISARHSVARADFTDGAAANRHDPFWTRSDRPPGFCTEPRMARDERLGWIRDGLDLRRAHAPLSQPADRLAPTPDSAHADGGGSRCLDRHQRAPLPAGDARMGRGRGAAGRLPPPGEFPSRRGNSHVRMDLGRRADHSAHLDGVPSEHHIRYLYLCARRVERPPDAQAAVRVPRSPWRYTGRLPGRRPAG